MTTRKEKQEGHFKSGRIKSSNDGWQRNPMPHISLMEFPNSASQFIRPPPPSSPLKHKLKVVKLLWGPRQTGLRPNRQFTPLTGKAFHPPLPSSRRHICDTQSLINFCDFPSSIFIRQLFSTTTLKAEVGWWKRWKVLLHKYPLPSCSYF